MGSPVPALEHAFRARVRAPGSCLGDAPQKVIIPVGDFIGAGVNFLLAAAVAHTGTIGTPVAWTAVAFAIGLLVIPPQASGLVSVIDITPASDDVWQPQMLQ